MNYLYNGIELPALPEWDKEKYPYAVIFKSSIPSFEAYDSEPYKKANFDLLGWRQDGKCLRGYIYNEAVSWGELEEGTYAVDGITLGFPIWANFDVCGEDGTVYLAASDPIPVKADPIDKTSFLQGWLVGRRLAGMRKLPEVDPPESTKASVVDGVLVVTGNGTAAIVDEVLVVTGGGTAEIVDGILYVT